MLKEVQILLRAKAALNNLKFEANQTNSITSIRTADKSCCITQGALHHCHPNALFSQVV